MPMIDVLVEDGEWDSRLTDVVALSRRAAEAALKAVNGGLEAGLSASMTILLADDATLRDLNHRFRGFDKSTNVLSFPSGEAGAGGYLGDIALASGTVISEAEAGDKPLADHLCHLVVHGVLHLVGYDHEDDQDAEKMETLETAVLAGLGIADPYADQNLAQ